MGKKCLFFGKFYLRSKCILPRAVDAFKPYFTTNDVFSEVIPKFYKKLRLVFSRVFDIRGNLGNVKCSSFLSFTD